MNGAGQALAGGISSSSAIAGYGAGNATFSSGDNGNAQGSNGGAVPAIYKMRRINLLTILACRRLREHGTNMLAVLVAHLNHFPALLGIKMLRRASL